MSEVTIFLSLVNGRTVPKVMQEYKKENEDIVFFWAEVCDT
jgi:hypothetical protein